MSGCAKLAQAEYKRRHDNVARVVHWNLTGKCGFQRGDRWFEYVPESVLENDNYKLMWDYNIQTDHDIKARRPDLVIVNKREHIGVRAGGGGGGGAGAPPVSDTFGKNAQNSGNKETIKNI